MLKDKIKGLIPLASVEDNDIQWLHEPYIQANNVSIIRGDGGSGKSYLACAIMAAVSTGEQPAEMPGVLKKNGVVVYFGVEDDDYIIKNRITSCGCDLSRIFLYSSAFNMSDTEDLRQIIRQTGAVLVVFDPLQSYLGSKIDMNRANEIRPIMDGLRKVARDENCAIVIIEHLNKATKQKDIYRGIGSIDITSAARSVMLLGYHPKEMDTRVAIQIKTNSRYGAPIAFKIDSNGFFYWDGITDVRVEDLGNSQKNNAAIKNYDIVLNGIRAIAEAHPAGWSGRPTDIAAEILYLTGISLSPESIGRQIPKIIRCLEFDGIMCTQKRISSGAHYAFAKQC